MSEEQQNILIEAMEQATLYRFELLGAQAAEVMEALEQSCTIYNPTLPMQKWSSGKQRQSPYMTGSVRPMVLKTQSITLRLSTSVTLIIRNGTG